MHFPFENRKIELASINRLLEAFTKIELQIWIAAKVAKLWNRQIDDSNGIETVTTRSCIKI